MPKLTKYQRDKYRQLDDILKSFRMPYKEPVFFVSTSEYDELKKQFEKVKKL